MIAGSVLLMSACAGSLPRLSSGTTWSPPPTAVPDRVFDPRHSGTLMDPPQDLATWITKLPGVTLTAPPTTIEIGGRDATQLDLLSGASEVAIGPIPGVADPAFGFGPRHPQRIIVTNVDRHAVLISVGADDSADHFKRAVAALQPLIESIAWQ
jgi:hypothetical protein